MRHNTLIRTFLASSAALLVAIAAGAATGIKPDPSFPIGSNAYGKTFGQWSAQWWTWAIETPITTDGHPFFDATGALVGTNQSGEVWFVAAPTGAAVERSYTIPRGTALFVAQTDAECSNLEPDPFFGGDAAEQSACATVWGNYMEDVFFEIDGVPIANMAIHRVQSPQFSFTAPEVNILGVGAGPGTAVADGYYVFLRPLSVGKHIVHWGGQFVGTPFGDFGADVTDHITVAPR